MSGRVKASRLWPGGSDGRDCAMLSSATLTLTSRCDATPAMTAELGGPLPREGIEAKLARDVREAAADTAWIKMIIPDGLVQYLG